jgi:hypothetical protein
MIEINYLAVLFAAIAMFVIGAIFHSPPFGNLWMKLAKIKPTGKEKFSDMVPMLVKNFLVNIVFAYGLAIVYLLASTSLVLSGPGLFTGLHSALLVWFFFVLPVTSIEVIWMGKSAKLWLYEAGVSLLSCIAMGAIISSL